MIKIRTFSKKPNFNLHITQKRVFCTSDNNSRINRAQIEILFWKEMENLVEVILMLFEKWKLILILWERIQIWTPEHKYFSRKDWFQTQINLIIESLVSDINSCIDELNGFYGMDLPEVMISDINNPFIPRAPSTYEVSKADVDTENLPILASKKEMQIAIKGLQENRKLYRAYSLAWINFSDINYIIRAEQDLWDRFKTEFEATREPNSSDS